MLMYKPLAWEGGYPSKCYLRHAGSTLRGFYLTSVALLSLYVMLEIDGDLFIVPC